MRRAAGKVMAWRRMESWKADRAARRSLLGLLVDDGCSSFDALGSGGRAFCAVLLLGSLQRSRFLFW